MKIDIFLQCLFECHTNHLIYFSRYYGYPHQPDNIFFVYLINRIFFQGSLPNGDAGNPNSAESQPPKREFELSDCLDYIRTGVEAIIEDQVTSRFEAEELKSWNLLTRTNHNYEFISWRLTVIWMFGFLMRYAFLMPLRVAICFFGVSCCLFV